MQSDCAEPKAAADVFPIMANSLVNKLSAYAPLPSDDVDRLAAVCNRTRSVQARQDLIREGDKPGPVIVILEGWACRYKIMPEGTRQITAFLMPGDCCDMHASVLDHMEHSIATVSAAKVAMVPRREMEDLVLASPTLTRAFFWSQLVDEDTLRAWIASMGRRNSIQRVAHLMCELYVRARNVGLIDGGIFEMPLTQAVLGDALGLTGVHVNRVLRKLRLAGVMKLSAGSLAVADAAALAAIVGFDDNYLHRRLARSY